MACKVREAWPAIVCCKLSPFSINILTKGWPGKENLQPPPGKTYTFLWHRCADEENKSQPGIQCTYANGNVGAQMIGKQLDMVVGFQTRVFCAENQVYTQEHKRAKKRFYLL